LRATVISKTASILGTVIAGYFAVRLSEFASVAGAQLGGLEEGGWNWQFLGPLAAGRVLGIAITVLVAVVLLAVSKSRILPPVGTLFCAPALLFFGSAIVYAIQLHPQKKAHAETMGLISKACSDPQFRYALVTKARKGTISRGERWAIAQAVYGGESFPEKDISFLIKYFSDDVSVVDPLLRYKGVTEEDIREAYEAHKLDSGHSRISEVLVKTGMAPLDILEDIAEHNSRYPHSHRYPEHLIQKARDQFQKGLPSKP
jgi:hypothetical protein